MYIVTDDSEHNAPLSRAYPHSAIILRAAFGEGYQDQEFLHNTSVVAQMWNDGQLDGGCVLYQPYIEPGTPLDHYNFLWSLIGPKVPDWLTGVMLDEESWNGASWAQHGDKSAHLNRLAGMHAQRMGSWKSVKAYANLGDFNALWPHRDPRIDTILAAYTGHLMPNVLPHEVGQQYTDGQLAPPKGLPSATPPFGPCDHNVFFGVNNAAQFRALWGRPPRGHQPVIHKPPVAKPPAPKPPVATPPQQRPPTTLVATSPNRAMELRLHNDGGLTVRENGNYLYTVPRGK